MKNTSSSYIAKSKAHAYHDKWGRGNGNGIVTHHNNTQSFDFSGDDVASLAVLPNESQKNGIILEPSPSPAGTPRFGKDRNGNHIITADQDHDQHLGFDDGGIESAVRNNLSIQIEEPIDEEDQDQDQDQDVDQLQDYNALSPMSMKLSPRLIAAKSYSAEVIELTPKNSNNSRSHGSSTGHLVLDSNKLMTRSRGASLSNSGGRARTASLSNLEPGTGTATGTATENSQSRSKRELSRIKREKRRDKKEKWKYYQNQQATGMYYV